MNGLKTSVSSHWSSEVNLYLSFPQNSDDSFQSILGVETSQYDLVLDLILFFEMFERFPNKNKVQQITMFNKKITLMLIIINIFLDLYIVLGKENK